jgi:hypothetical protein
MDSQKWIYKNGFTKMDSQKWIYKNGFTRMNSQRWINKKESIQVSFLNKLDLKLILPNIGWSKTEYEYITILLING